ncbi:MAG TPA: FadR/GntR family transcriptional regulator [Bryobacteraceae bacterium]|nr:FadR/GntR family transcriptional regulator [Bryobacteraceae bacterium]
MQTDKSIVTEDLTARSLAMFRELISSGEIRPGERLPPERELAQRFGVSRSSLRPVMKVLETVGAISQRVGDGSYLSADGGSLLELPLSLLILLDGVSLVELFEARLMIEPELAARAAECASSEDLADMRRTFPAMETDPVNADIAFHEAVCKATRNRVCYRMFGAIHQAFRRGMVVTSRLAPSRALDFHKEIYSAIHLRNPEEARSKMAEHLKHATTLLMHACLDGQLSEGPK